MDRFIKSLGLLVICLFMLAVALNATLERYSGSHPSSWSASADSGAYIGDLSHFTAVAKIDLAQLPPTLRRVKPAHMAPATSDYRWL